MVLAELGESLSGTIKQISNATDEKVLKKCLEEVTRALLRSDVQFKFARDIEYRVKNIANLQVQNKRHILQKAIFNELFKMLDSGNPSFIPEIGKPSVIMFVGLQGSGKTTTCAKYAHFHSNKGWKPALVCADTASFDQLKQNATKSKIPFYGRCTESDPLKIAVEGVERFKKDNHDLIIVDTGGGRYKQEAQLFEEMQQASEAMKPDLVIFVIDSSIGRAAFEQAQAFKQSVSVGAVILTKMDAHAKGAGALTAVSATKSPVLFIGTGENMDDFEVFDAKPFVGRLLGMGNWSGLMDKNHKDVPVEQPRDLWRRLYRQEDFTPRLMYEQYKYSVENGIISKRVSKTPAQDRFKKEKLAMLMKCLHMMDWMTNEELDNLEIMDELRIKRIAQESGHQVCEVTELMERFKSRAERWQMDKMRKAAYSRNKSAQHTSKVLAPQMLKQRGGIGDLQTPMQQMALAEDMLGKSCRGLPTERAAPGVVKVIDALRSSELRDDATCVVVDIIPPGNSFLPETPAKKPNKLKTFLSWRKHWDSVDMLSKKLSAVGIVEDLSEEGFAMLAKSDVEDVHMLAKRNCWPGLHGIQRISKSLAEDRYKKERQAMVMKCLHIKDWMTNEELDNPEIMDESRIRRIAQESGHQVYEVTELMENCKSRAERWQMDKKRKARAGPELCSMMKKMCI